MVGKQGLEDESGQPELQHSNAADADVWAQLGNLAASDGADPVLHLLVSEARARHEELRGVTATIASRYRSLVDAIPDAVIILDQAGNVVDANDAACTQFRHAREVILQSTLSSLVPGLDSEFLSDLHEAHGNEFGLTSSASIVHEDGFASDLEIHAREYLDAGRIRVIAVLRDLGQRELATRQLRESETRLRRLMQTIDKGVIEWSRNGRILSANPTACGALQMNEAELRALGTDQLDRWRFIDDSGHPMQATALPWNRALASGNSQESQVCGIVIPGQHSTVWLSVTAVPHVSDVDRKPDRVTCVFTEVTALQCDAMLFVQAQSLKNFAAWKLDFESHALLCSSQMHTILDVPMSTPISRERLLGHFSGVDLDRFRQAITAAREGRPDMFEAQMTTSIGRKRRVRVRLRPVPAGSVVGAVFGTLRDITSDPA